MITSKPGKSCTIDNIRGKIADLREVGFADPVKMIASHPSILSYSIDSIRTKIANLIELGFVSDNAGMMPACSSTLSI